MAEKIVWDSLTTKWRIENYTARTINDTKEIIQKGTRMDTTLNLVPSELYIKKEYYEEMTFSVLNHFIRQEELKGSPEVVFYKMEKHNRLASPFATLVMTLIGVSLSSRKIRGGTGMHLGLGILLTFAYILFMRVTTVFATYGNLPPPLAAWIPNFIFFFIGIYLLKTAPK